MLCNIYTPTDDVCSFFIASICQHILTLTSQACSEFSVRGGTSEGGVAPWAGLTSVGSSFAFRGQPGSRGDVGGEGGCFY